MTLLVFSDYCIGGGDVNRPHFWKSVAGWEVYGGLCQDTSKPCHFSRLLSLRAHIFGLECVSLYLHGCGYESSSGSKWIQGCGSAREPHWNYVSKLFLSLPCPSLPFQSSLSSLARVPTGNFFDPTLLLFFFCLKSSSWLLNIPSKPQNLMASHQRLGEASIDPEAINSHQLSIGPKVVQYINDG